jgi:fumarate reductase flavoprotein subunit
VETVKAYNASCAAGEDKEFGKPSQFLRPIPMEGPYYAIYGGRFSEASMGGVTVNGNCQVLRNDGTPIPGLYAGGDCTSAMHRKGKLAVISELTWAVASSFTSGNQVVAYIDSL